jgi:hypothetical protein
MDQDSQKIKSEQLQWSQHKWSSGKSRTGILNFRGIHTQTVVEAMRPNKITKQEKRYEGQRQTFICASSIFNWQEENKGEEKSEDRQFTNPKEQREILLVNMKIIFSKLNFHSFLWRNFVFCFLSRNQGVPCDQT